MFVKICGVTTIDDALQCRDAGADAIGFNFWPGSRRHIAPAAVLPIARALGDAVLRVGVFVNAPASEVEELLGAGVIDRAQLHGDETPEYCAAFGERAWRALRLSDAASLGQLDRYSTFPGELLIDADTPGYGGSGRTLDLTLAAEAAQRRRVILAGGLTPDNVAEAIARVRPYGVDVAGGVERAPGKKDHAKVTVFVRAAKGIA